MIFQSLRSQVLCVFLHIFPFFSGTLWQPRGVEWGGRWDAGDICIPVADSCWCMTETNITVQNNYPPLKNFFKFPHFFTTDNILNSLYIKYTFFHCVINIFVNFLCVLFKSSTIMWTCTLIHTGLCCIYSWFHRWTWCTLLLPGSCYVKACSSVSKGVMRWKILILLTWPKLTKPEIIWTYHY